MRLQNEKLKANYDAVRRELLQLRQKHNGTRAQLLEVVESRVEADQRTEALVHKWKVQLEARTRELESLQAKLVPQDLDTLRAKVQEELEVPHRRRVAALEAEVEKHRQLFFGIRREHERCKVRARARALQPSSDAGSPSRPFPREVIASLDMRRRSRSLGRISIFWCLG